MKCMVVAIAACRRGDRVIAVLSAGLATLGICVFPASAQVARYETGLNPSSIAVGDLNADGRLDMAIANYGGYAPPYNGSVSISLGRADGTFELRRDYETGDASTNLTMADLNGDSRLDLVVANYGADGATLGSISVLLGNGDGTVQPRTNYSAGVGPYCVTVADVNGDGGPDLVATNWNSSTVSVLLGRGDGTFGSSSNFGTGDTPKVVAVGDFDGDHKLDLAVANVGTNTISVLRGRGDGTFAARVDCVVGRAPSSVASVDLNQDGRLDLVVARVVADSVSVLLGNGDGSFGVPRVFKTGSNPWQMTIDDVNADRLPDVVTANSDGTVSVLLGRGDGLLEESHDYGVGNEAMSVAVGDIDGDGRVDLLAACNGRPPGIVAVLLGNADGSFGPAVAPAAGYDFQLLSLTPNPTRGAFRAIFSIPWESSVRISVFDITGRRVGAISDYEYPRGTYATTLDATAWRVGMTAQVFFVRFEWPRGQITRKVALTP